MFALVIGGGEMEIGFGNLHVVAKDGVEADFERADAGAFTFALFHGGNDLFAVLAEVAQFVELSVKTVANDAGFRRKGWRFVREGALQAFASSTSRIRSRTARTSASSSISVNKKRSNELPPAGGGVRKLRRTGS